MIQKKIIPLLLILGIFVGFMSFLLKPQIPKVSLSESFDNKKIKKELLAQFQNSYVTEINKSGKIIEIAMTASESTIEIISGIKTKSWSYNDQVPGPEIRLSLGDTLKVTFTNNLPQETTIHWHGVRVPNAMDGVPGVTQDPIEPGETFIYEFTPKDPGTFWFHPHVRSAEQVERGLYGTLIVEDPKDPAFDLDKVLVIDDWRLMENGQINPQFVSMHDLMHDGRWGNVITVNGKTDEVLSLQPGSINRLRLVNTSNARIYKLDFGRLKAKAISVDGMKVGQVFDAQNFELSPGNRIDVVIYIPDQIDISGDSDPIFTIRDIFTRDTNILATIRVKGDVIVNSNINLPIADHFPDWSNAIGLKPDQEYILDARRAMGMMGIEWTINGKAYPDVDPITLKANTFNKIRFTNASSRLHPMHLHGQFFQVIARNGQPVDEPYWRDTVLIHSKEIVDIALVPLDKGSWISHCHILEHAEAGMMTLIEVK